MPGNDMPDAILEAGSPAPDFTLSSSPEESLTLSDLRGNTVILAFYPADFSPVCGDQMVLYNEILPEFEDQGARLLGISVDGVWCHAAFSSQNNLGFPLLADFEPKGEVSRMYGAYNSETGVSERALFVIDPEGIIHWSHLSPRGTNPGADGILKALDELAERDR